MRARLVCCVVAQVWIQKGILGLWIQKGILGQSFLTGGCLEREQWDVVLLSLRYLFDLW